MVNLKPETAKKIYMNRHQIILGAFLIGVLYIIGFLPDTTPIFNIGEKLPWVYAVIMAIGAFVYFLIYAKKYQKAEPQTQPSQPSPQGPPMPPPQEEKPKTPEEAMRQKVEKKIKAKETELEVVDLPEK